ncbi:CLUMA_CG010966, isoform A [Clunio marinus]|uniref:U6 snRNA-associated Sm-like protein LSm1 n=1 Tax=Clunio marinus TaxID=568069 RepID=A0A1J1IDE4_9DIPT|nr:CLUMA_CG010966, isoform A [Clunio marinus]
MEGTAHLLDLIDRKLMILLRDGRTLIGFLRSCDQFANLVLHKAIERIHVGDKYGDMERGIFIIRGENVVLLGEIDREKEEQLNSKLTQVSVEEILDAQRREIETKQEKSSLLRSRLKQRGLGGYNNPLLEENE